MSTRSTRATLAAQHLEPHRVDVLNKLAEMAKSGDPRSIQLFLAYAVGPAPHHIELTGADGAPLQIDNVTRRARIAAIVAAAKERAELA
jgi:hypothetical protein